MRHHWLLPLMVCGQAAMASEFDWNALDIPVESMADSDTQKNEMEENNPFQFDAWFRTSLAYGTESPDDKFYRNSQGLTSSLLSLNLSADYDLGENADIKAEIRADYDALNELVSNDYSQQYADNRSQLTLRDLYWQKKYQIGDFDFWSRVGNQTVAWGESESTVITDIVNPRNVTRPGQLELEDIREQVPALFFNLISTLGDYQWSLETIATYDADGNTIDMAQGEFDGYVDLHSQGISTRLDQPEKQWELASRLAFYLPGLDLYFVAGEINWDQYSLASISYTGTSPNQVTLTQDRVQVLGGGANKVINDWLFLLESAYQSGRKYRQASSFFASWQEKDTLSSMIGVEYSGFSNLTLTTQLTHERLLDWDDSISQKEDQYGMTLRLQWTSEHEKQKLTVSHSLLAGNNGSISRIEDSYAWTDQLSTTFSVTTYQADQNDLYYNIRHQDSIQVDLNYYFY